MTAAPAYPGPCRVCGEPVRLLVGPFREADKYWEWGNLWMTVFVCPRDHQTEILSLAGRAA